MTNPSIKSEEPLNRATIPTADIVKWIEPPESQLGEFDDYSPHFRNQNDYFCELQEAVAGISRLMDSEMSTAEILREAKMKLKQLEAENYEGVREYLGEHVTEQMEQINEDLDSLAALVAGIEASLAGFTPNVEAEDTAA